MICIHFSPTVKCACPCSHWLTIWSYLPSLCGWTAGNLMWAHEIHCLSVCFLCSSSLWEYLLAQGNVNFQTSLKIHQETIQREAIYQLFVSLLKRWRWIACCQQDIKQSLLTYTPFTKAYQNINNYNDRWLRKGSCWVSLMARCWNNKDMQFILWILCLYIDHTLYCKCH